MIDGIALLGILLGLGLTAGVLGCSPRVRYESRSTVRLNPPNPAMLPCTPSPATTTSHRDTMGLEEGT